MTTTTKWIDLKDAARLKVAKMPSSDGAVRTYLFVVGLPNNSEKWAQAISRLGFIPSPNKKYLVRLAAEGEKITAGMFKPVWPQATPAMLPSDQVNLDLSAGRKARELTQRRTEEESSVAVEVGEAVRLGRNADGDEVFKSPLGRYIKHERGNVFEGDSSLTPAFFLRAPNGTDAEFTQCAQGFVQSMILGEVQHSDDFERFLLALTDSEGPYSEDVRDRATTAIDSSALKYLERMYDTAQDAYGDSSRLYEFMPPYQGKKRGAGAMPIPLSVMAQRLLGDTTDKVVVYPNAYDGASFAFLPKDTRIRAFRGGKDLSAFATDRLDVEWAQDFDPAREQAADAMLINADPGGYIQGTRSDYAQGLSSLRILNAGGRAVIVLAADEEEEPGEIGPRSRGFYDSISRRFQIDAAFEISPNMTDRVGTRRALRVVCLRNRAPAQDAPMLVEFPVKFSWDEVKSYVDEAIVSMDLKEAESESIDVGRVASENDFQRPYIAFSKVGEARTMVPKNLQAPLQAALTQLERVEGQVDRFVERELGFGENTLGTRFSPEQVDAIGLSIFRMKSGRAPIVADETGIGKGRTISALATWANKNGKNVIFLTDRSNLFSDLARDMRDIEEWGRFRPLVMNADGHVMDLFAGTLLLEGTKPSEMKSIVENGRTMDDLGVNMVMATYSQIAAEDSEKAEWLFNQVENSLVIVDESHIAAGSDSNMSRAVTEVVTRAWACVYSSATWAKSSENLHVYARALPDAINIASLTRTMKSGGEAFSEVFSAMLARDGALIRREHDLSKLEFEVEVDGENVDRNSRISDQVAEVLGAMTYVGGEINRLLMRANNDTLAALKAARNARTEVVNAIKAARPRRGRRGENLEPVTDVVDENQADLDVNAEQPEQAAAAAAPEAPQVPETAAAPLVTGKMFRSSFGAGTVLYQVMRRLLAILNADHVANTAIKDLNEGVKPVIVFEETGETFVREIVESMTIPGLEGERSILPEEIPVPTIRDMLMKVVRRMGVIVQSTVDEESLAAASREIEGADDEEINLDDVVLAGSGKMEVTVEDLPGMSEESRESYRQGMQRIVEMIAKLPPLPLNAIDIVRARLEEAGLRVGEISGRNMTLNIPEHLRAAPIDHDWTAEAPWKLSFRKKAKPELNKTVYGFNHGELDAVLINRSAAAGISLHASPRFSDRRRRHLIEMQIPENPTDRIQLYGRVNRYDQIIGPKISVASTGIYGETRQLMMQNKKLARLSANIRSSRENAVEIKSVPDLLNQVGEEVCRRFLEENGGIRQRLGITEKEMENSGFSAASKLTSRLVLLKVSEQKMVYEELYEAFDEELIRLDLLGENPLRAKEMDIRAKVVRERIAIGVDMEGLGSAFDGPVYMKQIEWKEDLRPMQWGEIVRRIEESRQRLLAAGSARVMVSREKPEFIRSEELVQAFSGPRGTISSTDMAYIQDALEFLEAMEKKQAEAAVVLPAKTPVCAAIEDPVQAAIFGMSVVRVAPVESMTTFATPVLNEDGVEALAEAYRRKSEIFPELDLSPMIGPLTKILEAKSRVELVGTKFVDLNDALAHEGDNGVKRAWLKKMWVETRMQNLAPGSLISVFEERKKEREARRSLNAAFEFTQKSGIVLGLIPPPKGKESQLQRWKVEWIAPGDDNPRTVSISTLLEDAQMTTIDGEVDILHGPILRGFAFGSSNRSGHGSVEDLKDAVQRARKGIRKREGYILDGNLYLASEWAQATKNGHGVVYTDERGIRHRAIMLKSRILGGASNVFDHLPVRLWNKEMLQSLAKKLCDPELDIPKNFSEAGYLFPTNFASAMTENSSQEGLNLLIMPGQAVAMTMERKDMARVSRALKSEVKSMVMKKHPLYRTYNAEQKKAAEDEFPKVTTTAKRGKKPKVLIDATTPEAVETAIGILCRAVGLEVYVWPHSRLGAVAQEAVADYFTSRREAARQTRVRAGEPLAQLQQAAPAPTQEEVQPAQENLDVRLRAA